MLEWRLNVVMAERDITGVALAKEIGISANSLSQLRRRKLMPRITPERLNALCKALGCDVGDLIVYVDEKEMIPEFIEIDGLSFDSREMPKAFDGATSWLVRSFNEPIGTVRQNSKGVLIAVYRKDGGNTTEEVESIEEAARFFNCFLS